MRRRQGLTLSVLTAVSASVNVWGALPSTCASQPRLTMFQSAWGGRWGGMEVTVSDVIVHGVL
jgi:hypothetical protein